MIYFDNAATSFPKAPGVSPAISTFLAESAANPGRAGHRLAVAAERMVNTVRLELARLFDVDDFHRMVFALNCTDALNMAIKGVLPDRLPNGGIPHVITTVLEHNSVSRPLQALYESGRIELTRVDCDDDGFVNPDDIKKAITPSTRLIVMTHASNVLGTIQDVASVGRIAREHDLLFCLDGAQSAGVIPISVKQMHVDLLAFPGHKSLLGPTGTGGLYVGERCPRPAEIKLGVLNDPPRLNAWREGGSGGDSKTPTQPAVFPHYLEGGTPNTVGIVGLGAGLEYIKKQGLDHILHHERAMVKSIIERFSDDSRFKILGTLDASRRVGTISLNFEGLEPSDVATILDDSFEIAVRPGLHCSPYAHKRMGTYPSGAVRISPGPFNTIEELETLLDALQQIAG